MYKYILQGAGDINWMALFALLTFFILFVISLFVVFFRSKSYIHKMSHLPLDDSFSSVNENESQHE
ncbi:MAG: CcoQ/FixQ family Cbb3-type cytochrome c oxidase assembly chaperone [Bacteroidota bacterium]